jgi:DNA-binding transcriptional ArsR family regulator
VTRSPQHASLTPAQLDRVARRFRLLGEPSRLRILQALHRGEKTVTEIVDVAGLTQSNVSRHLQALSDSGLLGRRRQGNNIYYFISDTVIFKLCDLVCDSVERELQARLLELRPRKTAWRKPA